MKNLTLATLCLVAVFFAVSCKTRSAADTTQSISKSSVKGNWIVTDIRFEGIPAHSKVTVFDQASFSCFKGSQWVLPSNANGSYTLSSTDDGCSTATQPIVWSLYKEDGVDKFQFKKVGTGLKAKDVKEGYKVQITSLSNTTMEWKALVNYESKSGAIIYTLQRS